MKVALGVIGAVTVAAVGANAVVKTIAKAGSVTGIAYLAAAPVLSLLTPFWAEKRSFAPKQG